MSSLITKTIEPQTGTTVTLGAAGDTVDIAASQLKTNTVKDAGGNTIFTSNGSGTLSSVNSGLAGSMVFISSVDGSGASYIDFTSGIDSTYDEYVFICVNLNPNTDGGGGWRFQADVSGGTSYAQTMTTTNFTAYHTPTGSHNSLSWQGGSTQGQGTGFQPLTEGVSGDSDHSASGILHVFAPSSTTYVKNFYSTFISTSDWNEAYTRQTVGGYFNTTSALTNFRFKFNTGTIDTGTVYLYGIS